MPSSSFVQGKLSGPSIGVNTIAVAFTSGNTKGNILFLVLITQTSTSNFSLGVADTQGNIWQSVAVPVHSAHITGLGVQAWYALNCKAGPNTVTVSGLVSGLPSNFTSNTYINLAEYVSANSSPLVVAGSPLAGSSSTMTGNSITPAALNSLIIGYGNNDSQLVPTAGGSFTIDQDNTSHYLLTESEVQASESPIAATIGLSGSGYWITGTVAFGVAAQGGGGGGLNLAMDASLRNCGLRH
jgi:hypothetical protein